MRAFNYCRPTSYGEAFHWLAGADQLVVPVAGATDLIPRIRDGFLRPDVVLDIKDLPDMRALTPTNGRLTSGEGVTPGLYAGAARQ